MKDIKLVVTDLDGTLLDSHKDLSLENIKAIKELEKNNIMFSFATGRMPSNFFSYSDLIGMNTPIICGNGTALYDPIKDKNIYEVFLEPDLAYELIKIGERYDLDIMAVTTYDYYFSKNSFRIEYFKCEKNRYKLPNHNDLGIYYMDDNYDFLKKRKYNKITYKSKIDGQCEKAIEDLKKIDKIAITSSEKNFVEALPIGVDKGFGLRKLCEILNINLENTCAFGDFTNDLEMLSAAGLAIGMGNCSDDIKDLCDYIVADCDNSGVAEGIRKYILK